MQLLKLTFDPVPENRQRVQQPLLMRALQRLLSRDASRSGLALRMAVKVTVGNQKFILRAQEGH